MSTSLSTSGVSSHRAMAAIEARRLARHPVFIVGVVLAFAVLALMLISDDPSLVDTLSIPVVPAFFIGLTSLIADRAADPVDRHRRRGGGDRARHRGEPHRRPGHRVPGAVRGRARLRRSPSSSAPR